MRIFSRYFLVALIVGLATLLLREILGFLLSDFSGKYGFTMILAYCVGILLNYFHQSRYTFVAANHRFNLRGAARFGVIAVLSSLLVAFAAYLLRYGLGMDRWLFRFAPAAAFGGAALLASPLSFYLHRRQVFLAMAVPSRSPEPKWVWPSLGGLSMAMFFLYSGFPASFNTAAKYDSALFLKLAGHLVNGEWLGAYNNLTLAKGAGFPLWLAGVHLLGVPVSAAAVVFYACSCLVVYFALQPLIPSCRWRLVLFAALLFCPEVFSSFRLLRGLIYPGLTLLVIAACLGFSLRMGEAGERLAPWLWGAGLGASVAFFWITREESVWLAPLLLIPLWSFLKACLDKPACRRHVAAVCLFAVAFFLFPLLALCGVNYKNYGLFTDVETARRPFTSAYGALARIRKPAPPPLVPVSKAMRRQAYGVSPSFAELEPVLERIWAGTLSISLVGERIDNNADFRQEAEALLKITIPSGESGRDSLRRAYATDANVTRWFDTFFGGKENAEAFMADRLRDEIAGGWFLWALRDAAAAVGYHKDASTAAAYYRRLAEEINGACAQGQLTCHGERHTLSPVLQRRHIAPFLTTLGRAFAVIPEMITASPPFFPSAGPPGERRAADDFLGNDENSRPSPRQSSLLGFIANLYLSLAPVLAAAVLLLWLYAAKKPCRRGDGSLIGLWLVCGVLSSLVVARVALMSLISVTSWPAIEMRYVAPAFPPLILFVGVGLYLGACLLGCAEKPRDS